jgi:hypothetical protein
MPITVEKLPNEPIVIIQANNPYSMQDDVVKAMHEFKELLDAAPAPLWDITDTRNFTIGFSDLVGLLGFITHGELGVVRHRNFAGTAIIANSEMIRMAGNALRQKQYGGISVNIVSTLDEALAYVRNQIKEKTPPAAK